VCYDLPVWALTRQDLLSPRMLRPRRKISKLAQRFIDRVLYEDKLRSRTPHFNQFKGPGVEYTREEIASARLIGKNLSGAIFLNEMFAQMYPDAKFVYLVRNGLALCEGYMRRGKTPEFAAHRYRTLVNRMLDDCQKLPGASLLRFEDILSDPAQQLERLYESLDLDPTRATHLRLQNRKKLDEQGQHRTNGGAEWDVVWFPREEIGQHLDPNVNDRQLARLSESDRQAFLREAGDIMELLGYPTDASAGSSLEKNAA